jgi:hypothetical protein
MSCKVKSIFAACFMLSITMFIYYTFLSPLYYAGSVDMFYYQSIAENLFRGKGFYDGTIVASAPVITPQNGIVFLHLLLLKLGFTEPVGRFQAIMIINYFLFASTSLILLRFMLREMNLESLTAASIAGMYLISNMVFKALVAPINDGIYFFCEIALFYLIVRQDNRTDVRRSEPLALIVLALTIMFFRNQGIFILTSATLAHLLLGRYIKAALYGLLVFVSSTVFSSVTASYLTDRSGIRNILTEVFGAGTVSRSARNFATDALPKLFTGIRAEYQAFAWIAGSVVLVVVLGTLVTYSIRAWRERKFLPVFMSICVISNFAFFWLFPFEYRYILSAFPFILIMLSDLCRNNRLMPIFLSLYLCFLVLLSCFHMAYWDIYMYQNKENFAALSKENLPDDATLISQSHRFSYFIVGRPSWHSWLETMPTGNYLIFGNQSFIESEVWRIQTKYRVSGPYFYDEAWVENRLGRKFRLARVAVEEKAGL